MKRQKFCTVGRSRYETIDRFPCLGLFWSFSRERLRRVLRKKTSAELRIIYIFTSSHLHIYTSAHLHICTPTSPLIFTSLLVFLHLHSSSHLDIYISADLHILTSTSLLMFISAHRHLCSSSHPHIYISHLHLSLFFTLSLKAGGGAAGAPRNAALCGDRACRGREMQARVRFGSVRRNPLRISCVSRARNAGESAIWFCPAQPCGDCACRGREMQTTVR